MQPDQLWIREADISSNYDTARKAINAIFDILAKNLQSKEELRRQFSDAFSKLESHLQHVQYVLPTDYGRGDTFFEDVTDAVFENVDVDAAAVASSSAATKSYSHEQIIEDLNQSLQVFQQPQSVQYLMPVPPATPKAGVSVQRSVVDDSIFLKLHEDVGVTIENVTRKSGNMSEWAQCSQTGKWVASDKTPYRMRISSEVRGDELTLTFFNRQTVEDCTALMSVTDAGGTLHLTKIKEGQHFRLKFGRPSGEKGRVLYIMQVHRGNEVATELEFYITSKTTVRTIKKDSAPPSPMNASGYTMY